MLPVLPQKERRLTGLHPDIEELLFDPNFKGAVGACCARCACCALLCCAALRCSARLACEGARRRIPLPSLLRQPCTPN